MRHRRDLQEILYTQDELADRFEAALPADHCPKMLPPYEAHGSHDDCAGLAAHPLTQIGRRA